jgi:hypothetical protein
MTTPSRQLVPSLDHRLASFAAVLMTGPLGDVPADVEKGGAALLTLSL